MFYSTQETTADIVHGVLSEMLEKVEIQITEIAMKGLVEKICNEILMKASVESILKNIIESLPEEPTAEQQKLLEGTAEMLVGIEEPAVKHILLMYRFII